VTGRANKQREVVVMGNRTDKLGCVPVCVIIRRNGDGRMSRWVYTWSRSRTLRKQRRKEVDSVLYSLCCILCLLSHSAFH